MDADIPLSLHNFRIIKLNIEISAKVLITAAFGILMFVTLI